MTLNAEQLAAVNSESKNIVVVATAGTGKTRVLVERTLKFIRNGERGIVIVTFTNAAAGEVIQRLKDAHGGKVPDALLHAGTLHAYMLKLIIEHAEVIPYPNQIAVLDAEQSRAVLDDAIEAQRYRGTLRSVKEAVARGPLHYFRNAPAADNGKVWAGDELVAAEYYRRMREGGLLDYDSILELGLDVLRKRGCACKHLLCDEVQDSGPVDWNIYQDIHADTQFYVGDPQQAIFGFRHANYRGATFPIGGSWKTHVLSLNYRSSVAVCTAATRLISHIGNAVKSIVSASGKAGAVIVWPFATELAELTHVVEWCKARESEWNEIAVLVRTNWIAERFARALKDGDVRVAERLALARPIDWRDAKDVVSWLANPENDLLAHRVLTRTMGRSTADSKRLQAVKEFTSLNRNTFNIQRVVTADAIGGWLCQLNLSDYAVAVIERLVASNETLTTAADVSLALAVEDTTETGPGITVTTIHGAKGKEWNTVLLPAFNEGIIPWWADELEDERRVAFVALTRARNEVHVSYARSRGEQWKRESINCERSRFIEEMNL